MKRVGTLRGCVCAVGLALAAPSTHAAGVFDIASMPYAINAPGHYRLVSSIIVPTGNTNPVITVNASNGGVLIDLNGFMIGGVSNFAPAVYIPPGRPDVVIENGFIVNVRGAPAIRAESVRVTIRDITFSGCDNPVQASSSTVIDGCLAWNGSGGNSTNGAMLVADDSLVRDVALTDFRVGGSPRKPAVEVNDRSLIEGVVLRDVAYSGSGLASAFKARGNSALDRAIIYPLNHNSLDPLDAPGSTNGSVHLRAVVAHGSATVPLTAHTATESVLWGASRFDSFKQVTHSITYGGTSMSPGFQNCEQLYGVIAAGHTNVGTLEAAFNKQDGPWAVRRSLSHRNHWRDARLLTSHKSFVENLISTFSVAEVYRNDSDSFNRYHSVRDNHLVGAGAEILTFQSWVEGNSLALTAGTNATISGVTPITNPGNNFITDQPRANFVIH